ncbi:hypothetical protein RJ639_033769 [Escallonia herrerae]|uniref:Uncharacterized protein n=1 Tax=Escallonia herrerae TaxID=1293975 RepID=A0AA89BIS2_9ASTE|nr:hypothetical protein RJ639_033769 [Escallonia herrerae]
MSNCLKAREAFPKETRDPCLGYEKYYLIFYHGVSKLSEQRTMVTRKIHLSRIPECKREPLIKSLCFTRKAFLDSISNIMQSKHKSIQDQITKRPSFSLYSRQSIIRLFLLNNLLHFLRYILLLFYFKKFNHFLWFIPTNIIF